MANDSEALSPSAASVPLGDAAFLRAVLEAIPLFVLRLDPEQRIRYINHLRGGVTLDQVIDRPAREFVAPEDYPRYEAAASRALRTGEPCSYTARGSRDVTQDGAAHYDCHVVPIDNGDGRRALCIVATDATAHMKRANALAQSEEKLRIAVELILSHRGHHVHAASDGQAGVALLDAGLCPDLILLDRSMPGWPVKLTLDEIRKRALSAPILFFTGQDVTSDERSQVQQVLYKPLAQDDLVRAVESWLALR